MVPGGSCYIFIKQTVSSAPAHTVELAPFFFPSAGGCHAQNISSPSLKCQKLESVPVRPLGRQCPSAGGGMTWLCDFQTHLCPQSWARTSAILACKAPSEQLPGRPGKRETEQSHPPPWRGDKPPAACEHVVFCIIYLNTYIYAFTNFHSSVCSFFSFFFFFVDSIAEKLAFVK